MSSSSALSGNLILQILSRLPLKSVARFRCLSKHWASILGSPYFKELFLTNSLSKPRLLFAIAENGNEHEEMGINVWRFFSLPQFQNSYEKSSSATVEAAEYHVKFSLDNLTINHHTNLKYFSCGCASGLIYFHGNRYEGRPVICNPNTGRYAILPKRYSYRKAYSFFGFDPIGKQYKALFMAYPSGPGHHRILTFRAGGLRWRKIKCPLRHDIKSDGVCINGVLYYLGGDRNLSGWSQNKSQNVKSDYVIVCFDVRSERFTFIYVERICRLINYKGKLAVIYWEDDVDIYELLHLDNDVYTYWEKKRNIGVINELRLWVLEDVEKQEWSKHAYTWTDDKFFRHQVSIVGSTYSGEIVFSMRKYTCGQPFYVFYFSPERNTLRRVEIQGFGEGFKKPCSVRTFVNHVEYPNINGLELLKSFPAPFGDTDSSGTDSEDSDREGITG
ncbi:PREDICTED: F-box protein At2g16450-like [Camelina sativa]|uniref:F-box protein At2g16450-like n=1 Tax=Camelina sativa TaxID=90675 RepID=A0ABM1QLU3_CAMSA|nr:PREDICTED: F-box protein At2g16450-like [Camelina sativa]